MIRKIFFVAIIFAAIFISACETPAEHFERREILMGTVVTIKAEGKNSEVAVNECFEKIFALEKNIDNDLKNLETFAGEKIFVQISEDVYKILEIAQKFSELTDGAFDVTIGAASDLWDFEQKKIPPYEKISDAKKLVGFKHLHLNEYDKTARLDTVGVKINLGGIAKGYGVDVAKKILAKYGIHDGLIDFGTSTIFASGKKRIGLKNPRAENEIAEIVEISDAAISTSGDYEKFFIVDGRRYHHIIDPATCEPADSGISAVSVVVSDKIENCGTVADILSTTIFILGAERAEKILPQENYKILSVTVANEK